MPLLALSGVALHYDGTPVLEDVTVKVEKGARIGVIGPNGAGKSTLLRLLDGRLEPNAGILLRPKGVRVGFQEQELSFAPGATVRDEMRRAFAPHFAREERLRALEAEMASDAAGRSLREYQRLRDEHEAEGGYGLEHRIEATLQSLGLPPETWDRPLEGFSGGERNVIALARVLLSSPDVMLLDEPTNHLDMDGVEWFLEFLRRSPAAVVMVSHNRHLLDATVDEIWEVARGRVRAAAGNYSEYQERKAEEEALRERQWKSQQRLIARIEFQARRLLDLAKAYDDPGQAKRAKSMLRRLDRMEKVERPEAERRAFSGSFAGGGRHGRIALQIRDFSLARGDRPLFERAELEVEYGERLCLVGPNGSGKTTLFAKILAEGSFEHPTLRVGKSVRAGEYRQLHDLFPPGETLLSWAMRTTGLERTPAAKLLHRFLFTYEDLERCLETLSGGEKSRLQFAKLSHEKVNLLLLDEPTNHLDLQACEQLEEMLQEFDGTLFVISHDRWFLDRVGARVIELRDRALVRTGKTFSEWYEARRRERRTALDPRAAEEGESSRLRSIAEREAKKARQREEGRRRAERERVEARIAELEARRAEVSRAMEAAFSAPEGAARGDALAREFRELEGELAGLYGLWETLSSAD